MSPSTVVAVVVVVLVWAVRRRAKWLKAAGRTDPLARLRAGRKWSVLVLVTGLLGIQIVLGVPAFADECGEAPIPERPGAGMVGAIDPPALDHGDPNSNYGKFSYAGSVWHVYDNNCVLSKTITDPNAVIDTWAGNQLFNVGKNIVGATNSLHYAMLSQDSILKPLDDAVQKAAQTFYNSVYVRWFGPVALILAVMLFRYIWTGDLATISRRGMWALAGMWLAASVLVLGPVYGEVDTLLLQKTSQIQAGFLPADQVDAQRNTLPDSLYDNVIYRNWLRGEFGDPNSPQAKQFGGELLDDQAWNKSDVNSADDQAKVTAKQNDYKALPNKLGSAAGFFEGSEGSRTGDGFLAFFQGLAYALFQLFAKAAVLLAQVLLRVLLLAAPLIGLAAMLLPELLPRVAKAAGSVLFNVLLMSALAGMDALLLNLIFGAGSQLSLLAQMLLASLITVVFFMVGRPVRRMWQMVELSVSAAGAGLPSSPSVLSKLRRKSNGPTPQEKFWEDARDGGTPERSEGGGRVRPEGSYGESSTVLATAQRMDRSRARGRELSGTPGAQGAPALPPSRPYGFGGPTTTVPEAMSSRVVDSPPAVDRGWDRGEDSFVVPSQVTGRDRDTGPRRAEPEMVAGRPVFVLYRPSRGLEVRETSWDSRSARG